MAEPSPASLAALVIHYGDPEWTMQCLRSLQGFDEVVVVDQPPQRLASVWPSEGIAGLKVRFVSPQENLGFAGGCNAGMAAANAAFVFVLNNDAVLAQGTHRRARQSLEGLAPNVAILCPKVLSADASKLQSVAGMLFSDDGIGVPRGFGENDTGQYDHIRECAAPSGAAFIVRREAWQALGGMSEHFFCYCEDGDLGLRLLAAGFAIRSAPALVVQHALSQSSGVYSLDKAYLVERNRIWTALHSAPASRLAALPFTTLRRLFAMAFDQFRGRGMGAGMAGQASSGQLLATLLRAWRDALLGGAKALQIRRATLTTSQARQSVRAALGAHRATLDELLQSRD